MRLPAEWEKQSGVQLTWPDETTPWYELEKVQECYVRIAAAVLEHERLMIVTTSMPDTVIRLKAIASQLGLDIDIEKIIFCECDINDTWARDHGGISVYGDNGEKYIYDFVFNGWGLKFASDKDNLITRKIFYGNAFNEDVSCVDMRPFVLEGGSIDSDGFGTLLTTKECLCSVNRNESLSQAELEALAEVLRRHEQVYVISDEIYEHINYVGSHASIARCEGMYDRTIVINGVSKAYAMTGWRIGFCAAPLALAKACSKLQGQYTSGPCSVSQVAATEAFAGPQECVEEMRQAFERRKELIVRLAREIPGLEVNEPHGAFYLFPQCSSYFGKRFGDKVIENSTDFAPYLLEHAHVATVGGDAFGSPRCFRMSYATSDENIVEAMRRIKEALAELA